MTINPACNQWCTAGQDVRQWLSIARETRNWEQAWRALTAFNPLPAVTGYVCYRRCELHCVRHPPVTIGDIEKFLGVEAIRHSWPLDLPSTDSGKHVLVVGSGPAGLAAAYELRRAGHQVTLHEGLHISGGLMRSAIPETRLPRIILDAEISRLLATGVHLKLNHPTRLTAELLSHYAAAVYCSGASTALALVSDTVLWRQPRHTTSQPEDRTVSHAIYQGRQAASAVNTHLSPSPERVLTQSAEPDTGAELGHLPLDPDQDRTQVVTQLQYCRLCGPALNRPHVMIIGNSG